LKNWRKFKERLIWLDSLPLRGKREITKMFLTGYWELLKEFDDVVFHEAIFRGAKYYWTFYPTPKEIRDVAVEIEQRNQRLLEAAKREKEHQEYLEWKNERLAGKHEKPEGLKNLIKQITDGFS